MRQYPMAKTWVEISSSALLHNCRQFQKLLEPSAALIAVVKSNAYGHGLVAVSRVLAASIAPKARQKNPLWFGVDSCEEALALRRAGIVQPILVLGLSSPRQFPVMALRKVHFALSRIEDIPFLPLRARFQIKIETGTNRLGVNLNMLSRVAAALREHRRIPEGFYTHFAEAENRSSGFWKIQLRNLRAAQAIIERHWPRRKFFVHASATAAALSHRSARLQAVRIGIGLYGLPPDVVFARNAVIRRLRPALVWKTRVAFVRRIAKGETIGYGRTFRAAGPMTIATLPVGYWDGYDRRLSGIGKVLFRGRKARVVGRVCMNMTMIDLSAFKSPKTGEEVILLGKHRNGEEISATEIASTIRTINYEVITRINPLIPRIVT